MRLEDSDDCSVSSIEPFKEVQKETEPIEDFGSYVRDVKKNLIVRNKSRSK